MSANDKQVGGTHYKGRKIQHWDYAAQLPYLEGLATKYIDRHREKGGKEDLLKAIHTIEKMIEEYYPAPNPFEFEPVEWAEDLELCPNASDGKHKLSHVYKHSRDGRLKDFVVCDLCHIEKEAP